MQLRSVLDAIKIGMFRRDGLSDDVFYLINQLREEIRNKYYISPMTMIVILESIVKGKKANWQNSVPTSEAVISEFKEAIEIEIKNQNNMREKNRGFTKLADQYGVNDVVQVRYKKLGNWIDASIKTIIDDKFDKFEIKYNNGVIDTVSYEDIRIKMENGMRVKVQVENETEIFRGKIVKFPTSADEKFEIEYNNGRCWLTPQPIRRYTTYFVTTNCIAK